MGLILSALCASYENWAKSGAGLGGCLGVLISILLVISRHIQTGFWELDISIETEFLMFSGLVSGLTFIVIIGITMIIKTASQASRKSQRNGVAKTQAILLF